MNNQFEATGKTLKGFKQKADAVQLMFPQVFLTALWKMGWVEWKDNMLKCGVT